jgi:hypothetical protein
LAQGGCKDPRESRRNCKPNRCLLRVDETVHSSHGAPHIVDKWRQLLAQGSELQASLGVAAESTQSGNALFVTLRHHQFIM